LDGLAKYSLAFGNKKGTKHILPEDLNFWRPSLTAKLFFRDHGKLSPKELHILN
jgi:hypothetical protein